MIATESRRVVSARARIVTWLMLLAALAVCSLIVITAQTLFAQADARLQSELGHEGAKLRAFATGIDPATGVGYHDTERLLSRFLSSNVPEVDETFFSIRDGRADRRSPHRPVVRLDKNADFVAMASAARSPVSGTVATASGDAHYAVFPVQVGGDANKGALVVVEFSAPASEQVWFTVRILLLVGAISLIAAGVVSWLVAGRVLAPIRMVRQTAEQISDTDLGRRIEVVGTDDVAQLASTFNRMLDRVQAAFDGQRQFLDDASHELRTPITVIRGHLELMGTDSDERQQTTALVLDELQRMTRIVDDLMLLARSERSDFLIPGRVDLTELVVETLAKSRALATRDWAINEVAEQSIPGDGQRLTQALMQLVSNAVQHTADGDRISLGSRVADGRAQLWVRDSGAGIAAEDHTRIFDRFARGPDDHRLDGAGLGLPIVATIAAAHGGRVLLDSALGQGAVFTLDLPVAPGTQEDNS